MLLNYYGYDYWNANSLSHHGIKGQKWGVRRFQNPDGSLTDEGRKRYIKIMNKAVKKPQKLDRVKMGLTQKRTIPAGTTMYRTSATKNEQKNPGESVYVTYLEPDRNLYRGGWVRETAGADVAYEKTYKLKTDLKIPSRETCTAEIEKLMKDPKIRKEVFKSMIEIVYPNDSPNRWYDMEREFRDIDDIFELSESEFKKVEKQWYTAKGKQIADEYKNASLDQATYTVQASFGLAPKTREKLIEALKKQGYNAMADEASIGGRFGKRREGVDPLIVFDSGDLAPVKEETITENKEVKSRRKYNDFSWKVKKNAFAQWSDV